MKTYEIALARNGWVFPSFPHCIKVKSKPGTIFFFPSCENPLNVDIVLRANSEAQAKEKAIVLMETIEEAGLWGVDHCLRMAWFARLLEKETLALGPALDNRGPYESKADAKEALRDQVPDGYLLDLHKIEWVIDPPDVKNEN